jgi:hypothetical protein
MSSPAFTLHVPSQPPFRSLACDVVSRYIDLGGGTEAERSAFAATLATAIDALVGDSNADLELSCVAGSSGFEIRLRSGSQSSVVHHPLRTVKP